jgi:hypothetical protein
MFAERTRVGGDERGRADAPEQGGRRGEAQKKFDYPHGLR